MKQISEMKGSTIRGEEREFYPPFPEESGQE